jgi:hypothetical protein
MSTETKVVLTTLEVLKLRKAGWAAGWQEAEIWQEQHIDSDRPARMPDYTRGEFEIGNFVDVPDCDDDAESCEMIGAYTEAVEQILDDAATAAWNEWRDQHCDEDNCLIRDDE